MKNRILQLVFWCTTTVALWAQENVNMKFGKPTKAELEMTTYEADPQADAVVLCRLTNVEFTIQQNGYLVDYYEKIRIKVLKPDGTRYAQFTIPYYSDDTGRGGIKVASFSNHARIVGSQLDGGSSMMEDCFESSTHESVDEVKAVAYNLTDKKVTKTTLSKKDIVRQQIDETHFQLSFTVPGVQQGTIIECEYKIHSEPFFMMHDWIPQTEIPVAYAQLDMNIPCYLIYNMEEHGTQRLQCKCVTGSMQYKLVSDPLAAPVRVSTNHYTCIGRHISAIPDDIEVTSEYDYPTGITMELKSFSLQNTMPIPYIQTWKDVDLMLLDDDDLGKQLDLRSPLADELQAANLTAVTDLQKRAEETCKFVMERVRWNGQYRMWPKSSTATLKERTGSNADINLLLIQSLKAVGLSAVPVALRPSSEGPMPYNFPSFHKLTTFVVGIAVSNHTYVYIDASSPEAHLNVLPAHLLVKRARMVTKEKGEKWVNLRKLPKL